MATRDFLMPGLNYFGAGCVTVIGEKVVMFNCKKPLIVTDTVLESVPNGPVQQVQASLKENGLKYAVFNGVEPNPKIENCLDGLDIYEKEDCDCIVTVGGGSAHDCGKGIGIAATHGRDLKKYAGIELLEKALPPVFCVNTTAGTASEVTRHAVLTDRTTKLKFVIVSWRNVPLVSINALP